MTRETLAALLLLPVAACVIGSDKYQRPRDLDESWLVDRTRLLAVQAAPPEVRPGDTVRFTALMPQPDHDEEWPRIWFACIGAEDGSGFGCNLDLAGTGSTGTSTGFDEGFIGIEPGLPPTYTAPADLLDDLDDTAERAEGVQVLVQVAAVPPELMTDSDTEIDFNEIELGFKRLVVSEASTPNRNPEIYRFVIDRLGLPQDAVVHVTAGQSYDLGLELEEDLIETYEYLNKEGEIEEREEQPYATWYATGGEIAEPITLYPYIETAWIAPKRGQSGTWYAVVRDRRGGMTWHTQDWVVD